MAVLHIVWNLQCNCENANMIQRETHLSDKQFWAKEEDCVSEKV